MQAPSQKNNFMELTEGGGEEMLGRECYWVCVTVRLISSVYTNSPVISKNAQK